MANPLLRDIKKLLTPLVGLRCWHVGTGELLGSSFGLALGRKHRRRFSLSNPTQNIEFREYMGEVSLLVWCTWRLDGPVEAVTSSDEDYEAMATGLKVLVGQKILKIEVSPPAWDLCITFSNDLQLRVFCDHVPGNPSFDGNWQARVRDTIVAVGPGYKWRTSHAETWYDR